MSSLLKAANANKSSGLSLSPSSDLMMMIESRDKLMRNYVSEKFKNAMPSECRSFSRK